MVQVGIVSFGRLTCGDGRPAIYTRVTEYMEWIVRQLEP